VIYLIHNYIVQCVQQWSELGITSWEWTKYRGTQQCVVWRSNMYRYDIIDLLQQNHLLETQWTIDFQLDHNFLVNVIKNSFKLWIMSFPLINSDFYMEEAMHLCNPKILFKLSYIIYQRYIWVSETKIKIFLTQTSLWSKVSST